MKRFTLLLLAVVVMCGTVWGKNYEVTKKVDDITVTVAIDKNPPIIGDNNLSIIIKDGSGKIITDAKVVVNYGMPAMPGMPAMNYKANVIFKGSDYKTKVNFSMAGSWNMTVQISQGDKSKKVKLNVDVK